MTRLLSFGAGKPPDAKEAAALATQKDKNTKGALECNFIIPFSNAGRLIDDFHGRAGNEMGGPYR